jgi:hypothetical protein
LLLILTSLRLSQNKTDIIIIIIIIVVVVVVVVVVVKQQLEKETSIFSVFIACRMYGFIW